MFFKIINKKVSQISSKIPLRTILVVPFVLQIIVAVGLTGYLSFRNGQKAVNELATQLLQEVNSRISQHLKIYLETPYRINKINEDMINLGLLDLRDQALLERYFWRQMKEFDSVTFIGFGNNQGGFVTTIRQYDGSLFFEFNENFVAGNYYTYLADPEGNRQTLLRVRPNYDARQRPWYKAAVVGGKPTRSKIYTYFTKQDLGMSTSQPLYDQNGELQGVIAADLGLSQIGKFLQTLKIGKSGQTFIIERDGLLVASSTSEKPFIREKDNNIKRFAASESQQPLIRATAQYITQKYGNFHNIKNDMKLSFYIKGAKYFVEVVPISDQKGIDWLGTVVVPEADFMEEINANTRSTIVLCIIALCVAIIVGILTARWVIEPILALNNAAKEIAKGDWDKTVNIERSDELGELAKSFNVMGIQLKESFQKLEHQNEELQRLDKLKDEFLANTSHELRTPLNGIIGLAESLINGVAGPLSEQGKSNLVMIASSGRRLANLVNDILDFSKLRYQNIELQIKPISLREIVEIVLTLSRPLVLGKKNVNLVNQIPPDFPLIAADENRLQQIFLNLIGNAIKFTTEGEITVSGNIINDSVEITVSDTGIGISEDKFERIFESFEQADGSTAREYGGTGLGLAVTKQLVELHGGIISISSEIGVGSQFTFTLPIFQGHSSEIVSALSSPKINESSSIKTETITTFLEISPQNNGFKIMIVDDEPINLQVLVNHLSLENYAITQATNGIEALEIMEKGFRPDLILLDVMMPKMTGYEVTKKIRQMWQASELPVLLLTAKNRVSDLVAGFDAGANDYLTKPVEKDELLARIRTHLNLLHLTTENLRLTTELDITRKMQKMLLPKPEELKKIKDLEIAGFMEPAAEVGGDYYDVIPHIDGVKIAIGDVTGHGLESGVLMMMAQMAVRTLLESNITDPIQFLNLLNLAVFGNLQRMNSDKNMTIVLLDYHAGKCQISGQHETIILVSHRGELKLIDTIDLGFPIGLEKNITDWVNQTEIDLYPGDVMILYTDGITEAENMNREQYGLQRLIGVVTKHYLLSAEEIKQVVIDDLKQHIGTQKVYDDITLLILKKT
jgi:signal transduction histidine kinase/serine phosphatase RsbU (regulator of sigma subunit)